MKKLLALFLALALMASFAAVFSASEVPADPTPVDSAPESPVETESLLTEDLKKQIVPEAEVPDLIDYSVAVAEKYVCRAYWEETDLNEVVFLKSDGTLARYYFAIPVKYEENGEVFDKKPALVERETLLNNLYRYELTAQNDTAFYCPDNLTHGFLYQGGGMEVALRPITQAEYDFLRGHANAGDLVLPGNILPEGYDSQAVTGVAQSALSVTDEETTSARYVLSTEGETVNSAVAGQDILSSVPSYNGFQLQLDLAEGALTQTVYFELDSELLPIPTEGGLLLCDQKGNPVGILGDLLSESGVSNDIPWTVTESLSGTYLLSATLPRNGETYTLSTTNLFDYLLDASIYSADQRNYGQSANLWVGYHQSYSGIERVLIRPNNWYFTESAAPNQVVQSATLTIRDITVTSYEANIEARPFTGNVWTENEVCWNQASGNSYGPVLDSNPVSSAIGWNEGYYYSYDITFLVRNWYKGLSNWQKGLMICWDIDHLATSTMEKCFASSQYSNENYRPRLEITSAYLPTVSSGVYRIKSATRNEYLTSANSIDSGTDVSMQSKLSDWDYHQLWRVYDIGNGYYTIRPMHYTPATLRYSNYDVFVEETGVTDVYELVSSADRWLIQAHTYGYTIQTFGGDFSLSCAQTGTSVSPSVHSNSTAEAQIEWVFEDAPNPCTVIFYDETTLQQVSYPSANLYVGEEYEVNTIGYKVSMSMEEYIDPADYDWWTGNSSIAEVYDSVGICVSNAGSSSLYVEWFDSSGADYRVSVLLNCYMREVGPYFIRNAASDKYVDIKEQQMANGTEIHQWESHGHWTQKWYFERYQDFYYTIRSSVSGTPYYLSVSNSENAPTVVLKSDAGGITDDMLWYLSYTTSGNLKIAPKIGHAQGYVMAVVQDSSDQSQNGLLLKKLSYTDDAIYTDEWEFAVRINIDVFVDSGYMDRYSDYATRVSSIMQQVSDFYWSNFEIFVNYSSAQAYPSGADYCSSNAAFDDECNCFENGCNKHHRNPDVIINGIPFPDLDNPEDMSLLFTGYELCDGESPSNSCLPTPGLMGAYYPNIRCAYVANFAADEDNAPNLDVVRTTIHEIGHFYHAEDHCGQGSPSTDALNYTYDEMGIDRTYSRLCIYGEAKQSPAVLEGMLICDGCKSQIASYANGS